MRVDRLVLLATAVAFGVGSLALGQEAPEDALSDLRGAGAVTDEGRTQIRAFVVERVGAITRNDPALSGPAAEALRAAHAGPEGFQQAYAAVATEVINGAYQRAELVPATRLLAIATTFNNAVTQPMFTEALQDERVGVRAAAAVGLRSLRAQIAQTGGETFGNVVARLKAVGEREKSTKTLKTIYEALNYATLGAPPDREVAATAVLELLESRIRQYGGNARQVPAAGADDAGLSVALAFRAQYDEAERRRLLDVTARMMKFAIEEYRSPEKKLHELDDNSSQALRDYRDAMERIVLVGEQVLQTLLTPDTPPEVMEQLEDKALAEAVNAWNAWAELLAGTLPDAKLRISALANEETAATEGGG